MVWVDVAIPAIILLSAAFSVVRGFVREALSLLGWLLAFWLALRYSNALSELFFSQFSMAPSVKLVLAFTSLFVLTMMVSGLLNHLAGQVIKHTGLSGTDRMMGMIFGLVRGGVVVAILVLLAGLTSLPQDPWWHESKMLTHFETLAVWLQTNVAPEIADKFFYN